MYLSKKIMIVMERSLMMSLIVIALSISNMSAIAATTSNAATIQSGVTAFQAIKALRGETPMNGDAIAATYVGDLQALVQEIDETNFLELNNDIQGAINDIKDGKEPTLAGQVIDKTLQRVFYQIIWNRISTIRDQFDAGTTEALTQMLNEAEASFQAITGTVARENQILTADRQAIEAGSNPGLDVEITNSFSSVRTALNKSNPDEDLIAVQVARYAIRMSLARAYYIAVLREVAGVIEHRSTDLDETRKEQKEGEIFYRIIEPLVARGNPAGNLSIKAQLTGNPSRIVADEIVSELSVGIIARVLGEMSGQEKAIAGQNRASAMAEAAGAKYFARILLPDLELRLGGADRSNLESGLENLLTASNELSASKSTAARDAISAILEKYEGELYRAKYEITNHTAIVENAVTNYQAIGDLRNQIPIDAAAIASKYAGDLQQLTQIVDQVYGLSIDQDVSGAIDQVKNGDQVALALQVMDKSLQKMFALVVYNRVTLTADQFSNLSTDELTLEWDRAYAAYSAIAQTTDKEDKILSLDLQTITTGRDPDLDYQIMLAFVQGKQAINKANADDGVVLALARENIVIPLVRSFLIGVLRELEGIISHRNDDIDEAREEQIEAEYFYRTVEGFVAQDNPVGSSRIKAQLTGELANIVANDIVSDINKGIVGQLKRSIGQIEANFVANKNQALLAAERLSLYANIFLPDLELRLDTLHRVKLENGIRDLKLAIQTDDINRAIAVRSIINEVVADYENELI
ncbi:hypothetical protein C7H79_11430 [Nitrosomonas supralitoralis]|uniref:Uncharacterized protein n=2 Tax=Nitrosomonas supralitoralis TaxID=2116706 RepID=A0A2P7NTN4_9PROT|nr:hypothetical protein C7H79_11430 [Nitrosomonas supralitoralis]